MRYFNNFKRRHSNYLCETFDININGIDYHNSHNLGFEFKESFIKNEKNMFFKIPKKQAYTADYFIFCNHDKRYYLIPGRDIKKNFSFNTKEENGHIRINTVKLFSIFETNNINELKEYINKIKKAW